MEITKKHAPKIFSVLAVLLCLIVLMYFTLGNDYITLKLEIALACMVAFTSFIAFLNGYSWKDIETGIVDGCKIAIVPVIILMTIGLLIASWMISGIVPYLIYLAFTFINPESFLVWTLIICCITSLTTGSSWTTVSTVGIALLCVGVSIGIPAPMVVGCIISGAWFGDKMSPLSDSTNLAAAVGEISLFDHIKHMMWTTIPALVIAFFLYMLISPGSETLVCNSENIQEILTYLNNNYHFNILYLLPPLAIFIMAFLKVPPLPTLAFSVLLGCVYAGVFEGESLNKILDTLYYGYKSNIGIEKIDVLLSKGGLKSMTSLITIVILVLGLGGIMEKTKMLESLLNIFQGHIKSRKTLIPITLISSWITELMLASLYLAIILPGRMFYKLYDKLNLSRENMTRTLEDGGTMISPLIPWGFSGLFITKTLGVPTLQYLPYTFLNLIIPIFTIILALTGIGIKYNTTMNAEE